MEVKTFTIEENFSQTTSELDFQLYNELFGEEKTNEIYETDDKHPGQFIIDKTHFPQLFLSVDELQNIVNKLKENNSNYVYIDSNQDHPDYTFYGLCVRESTEEEIILENNKRQQRRDKQDKINDLYNEIRKLQG